MTDGGKDGLRPRPSSMASAVDLVSNAVLLAGVDISQAGYILQPGQFPDILMPSLLHETAHWDTFATPVGQALAMLFLRAWRRAHFIADDINEPKVERSSYEVAVDFTRYQIATEVLRPLCEGIALFSEFDLQPMESPITTTPTLLSGILFGNWPGKIPPNATVGQLAAFHMRLARDHHLFRARKENLLCQPFRTQNGGYLPGYYFVKNLRNYLVFRRRIFDLLDGDLFIFCLKSAIFGDLELARLLIDPDLDFMFSIDNKAITRDAVNSVLKRIKDQLDFLIHDMDKSFVKKIQTAVSGTEPWSLFDLQTLRDEDRLADNARMLKHATSDLVNESSFSSIPGRQSALTCRRFLENRNLLCLATFLTNVTVNEHGRCQVGSLLVGDMTIPYFSTQARPGFASLNGEGTFEIYFEVGHVDRTLCFSVVLGDECVACGTINPNAEFNAEEFVLRSPSLALASRMQKEMADTLNGVIGDYPAFEHYRAQIDRVRSQIYDWVCRSFVNEVYGGDFSVISDSDLLTLSGGNAQFLCDYAALSLQKGGAFLPGQFEEACQALKIDPIVFKAKLHDWRTQKRFPLSEEIGELYIFSL